MTKLAPVLAALSMLAPAFVRADAVEPPPDACPPGSDPQSSHSGPLCALRPDCTDDASCGAGSHCVDVRQCVDTRGCGGGWTGPDCTVQHVMDVCDDTRPCGGSATCTARRVCVAEGASLPPATGPAEGTVTETPPAEGTPAEGGETSSPPPAGESHGCSAGRGAEAPSLAIVLGALGVALAGWRRRRTTGRS